MTMNSVARLLTASSLLSLASWGFADEQPANSRLAVTQAEGPEKTNTPSAETEGTRTKRAIILCGLSGDATHHTQFAETVTKLHEGLLQQLGFAEQNVQVLFGDDPQESDSAVIKAAASATREEFERSTTELRAKLQPEDSVWVIVLGHSYFDGRHSWLNLPGPDLEQTEFAKLFADLPAQEQVFFITTPTSGFYIKPLSAKGRVIICATEGEWESNETEFPHELARVLTSPPEANEFDVDQDGELTLFDLYVTVARNLAASYLNQSLLSTEHGLLDDNGDGRGTEVQIDFLTEEQGGRSKPRKPSATPKDFKGDGQKSKSISLPWPRKVIATDDRVP